MGLGQQSKKATQLGNSIYFLFILTAHFEKCLFQWKDSFVRGAEDECLSDTASKENRGRNALIFVKLIPVFYIVLEICAREW